jgi:addiction module HigA family antidote
MPAFLNGVDKQGRVASPASMEGAHVDWRPKGNMESDRDGDFARDVLDRCRGTRDTRSELRGLPLGRDERDAHENPPHPGDFIRTEIIEPLGLSVTAAGGALGVSRPTLSSLLNGHAGHSGEMALRREGVRREDGHVAANAVRLRDCPDAEAREEDSRTAGSVCCLSRVPSRRSQACATSSTQLFVCACQIPEFDGFVCAS